MRWFSPHPWALAPLGVFVKGILTSTSDSSEGSDLRISVRMGDEIVVAMVVQNSSVHSGRSEPSGQVNLRSHLIFKVLRTLLGLITSMWSTLQLGDLGNEILVDDLNEKIVTQYSNASFITPWGYTYKIVGRRWWLYTRVYTRCTFSMGGYTWHILWKSKHKNFYGLSVSTWSQYPKNNSSIYFILASLVTICCACSKPDILRRLSREKNLSTFPRFAHATHTQPLLRLYRTKKIGA